MTAAAPNTWMPLWIGPYLANTLHLDRAQHGSYCLLIMACWKAGGRLPANDRSLANIAKCTPKEWTAERATFAEFFEVDAEWWIQRRVVDELEKAQIFKGKQTQNGAKGGRPRNPEKTQAFSQEEPKHNPTETTLPLPSPTTVTPTPSVANSARGRATEPARASLIRDDWQPSELSIAQLRKGRPDLVGAFFDQRMTDFRLWCRDKAVMSHDPEAAWLGFMRKSNAAPANGVPRETAEERRRREIEETMAFAREHEATLRAAGK